MIPSFQKEATVEEVVVITIPIENWPMGKKLRGAGLCTLKKDRLYCFCCNLFSNKDFQLASSGVNDWRNCNKILRSHENSQEHARHMEAWRELEIRLHKEQTIDKAEMALLQAERMKWREILTR